MDRILEVKDLHVRFDTREGTAYVLNGVDLELARGSTLGVVGEAGCGKSVLGSAILGYVRRPGRIEGGQVIYEGQDVLQLSEAELQALRGKEIAIISPNARTAFNPLLCVGDQIANVYQSHFHIPRATARAKAVESIAAVGINDPVRRYHAYPHEFSGGMVQRLVIAVGMLCSPRVLVADEPTSDLDVTIAAQVLDMMAGLITNGVSSNLILTRNLAIVAQYCETVAVMCAGQILEQARVGSFFEKAWHPYSRLLLTLATFDDRGEREVARSEAMPDKYRLPLGCPFSERCVFADNRCVEERPQRVDVGEHHFVRCHHPMKIGCGDVARS